MLSSFIIISTYGVLPDYILGFALPRLEGFGDIIRRLQKGINVILWLTKVLTFKLLTTYYFPLIPQVKGNFNGNPQTGNPKNMVEIQREYKGPGGNVPTIFLPYILGVPYLGLPSKSLYK